MAENEIQTTKPTQMQVVQGSLQLGTIDDLWRTAKMFVQSGLCPYGLDRPEKVVVVLQAGAELGFKPWQSMQIMHVINGRLGMEGSAMLALARKSGACEYITCYFEGTPYEDNYRAMVTSKRRNESAVNVTEFSVDDAKRANLWEGGSKKKDNWIKYPKDMLTWRAVSRHCRRYYSDLIQGMYTIDELADIEAPPLTETFVPTEDAPKTGTAGLLNRMKEETAAVTPPKHVESQPVEQPQQENVVPLEQTEVEQLAEADKNAKKKQGRPKGSKNKKKETVTKTTLTAEEMNKDTVSVPPEPTKEENMMPVEQVQEAPMPVDIIPEQAPEEEPAPVENPADKLLDEKDFTCKGCNHSFNKEEGNSAAGGSILCPICYKKAN